MGERSPTPRATGGLILNAIAVLAALLAAPYLLVPLMKLGFVGLVAAAPIAVVLYLVGFLVIDVGPVVGLALSIAGKARSFTYVTGALSLVSLVVLVGAVAAAKTRIDLDGDGRARGPAPAHCAPRVADASAIGSRVQPRRGHRAVGQLPGRILLPPARHGAPRLVRVPLVLLARLRVPGADEVRVQLLRAPLINAARARGGESRRRASDVVAG